MQADNGKTDSDARYGQQNAGGSPVTSVVDHTTADCSGPQDKVALGGSDPRAPHPTQVLWMAERRHFALPARSTEPQREDRPQLDKSFSSTALAEVRTFAVPSLPYCSPNSAHGPGAATLMKLPVRGTDLLPIPTLSFHHLLRNGFCFVATSDYATACCFTWLQN